MRVLVDPRTADELPANVLGQALFELVECLAIITPRVTSRLDNLRPSFAELARKLAMPGEARPQEKPSTPENEPVDGCLTPTQVATALCVTRHTVYRMLRSGDLPSIRIGSRFRIQITDFAEWRQSKTVRGAIPVAHQEASSL